MFIRISSIVLFVMVFSVSSLAIVLPNGEPDPAYAGFYAWYKADFGVKDIGGAAAVNGSEVGNWANALGNTDRDLNNPVGVGPAMIYETNALNGKSIINFNNGMGIRAVEAFWGELAQPATFFIVCRNDARTQADYVFDGANSTKRMLLASASSAYVFNGGLQVTSGPVVQDSFSVHAIKINGANSYHFINGLLWKAGDAGNTKPLGGLILGIHNNTAGNALDGAIAEFMVYAGALTDAERGSIEQYLSLKYNIRKNRTSGILAHKYDSSSMVINSGSVTGWNDLVGDWDLQGSAVVEQRPAAESEAFPAASSNVAAFDGDAYLQYIEADSQKWLGQPMTMVVVAKRNNLLNSPYIFDGATATERNLLAVGSGVNRVFGGNYNIDLIKADQNMWQIFVCIFDNFWTELYVDGYYGGMGLAGSSPMSGLTLGSRFDLTANFMNGKIAEVQIYSGALDDQSRESVENAIFGKYGISPTCGAAYTTYMPEDLNRDCQINFGDLAEIAGKWLQCTDPGRDECSSN
ncbi:MAG: hypothetical protein ABFD79_09070 [Phycisphaerales bacterium]